MSAVPPQTQSVQMQSALQDCITSLQHVYVQRHSIIAAKSDLTGAKLQEVQLPMASTKPDIALDQAFATSHGQLLGSIATLQKRLLLIQQVALSPTLASATTKSPLQH